MNDIPALIKDMTREEKASLCSGKGFWHLQDNERLGIPAILVADGPHGLRKAEDAESSGIGASVPATCFPTAVGLSSTWNPRLVERVGSHIGKEAKAEGVSVLLGPGANIKRHPLCGRNFEYFSEDPRLAGKLAASFIKGVQSEGVGASLKHFVANNQESNRMVVDALIDERTLREIYLKTFEIAIKEGRPWTVMSSYNLVNGAYMSENERLLDGVLRKEWGFAGMTVTDWGGTNDRIQGIKAGQDLEMPGSTAQHAPEIVAAGKSGALAERPLDERIKNILSLVEKATKTLDKGPYRYDKDRHHRFARKVAAESMVLLKNENDLLPLSKDGTIALIGEFAKTPRFQGSGSSQVVPTKVETAFCAFCAHLGEKPLYARGYDQQTDETDPSLLAGAKEAAKKADVAVLFAGLTADYESEGFDREHLELPKNHLELIEACRSVNENLVLVLTNGAPVAMPFKEDVPAILEAYLPGQAGGGAIADIVFGRENPSGKLAETFPNHRKEFPADQCFPGHPRQVQYREGIYVGYRYYSTVGVEPLFPFGHGLSYTTFALKDLAVEDRSLSEGKTLGITVTLENTGGREGRETVQLYTRMKDSVLFRPALELKDFKKIPLSPGEEKRIEFTLDHEALAVFAPEEETFLVEGGTYEIALGFSASDIRRHRDIVVSGKTLEKKETPYHDIDASFQPSTADFETILGHSVPEPESQKPYHNNSTLGELKKTLIGRLLFWKVVNQMAKRIGSEEASKKMISSIIETMPYRNLHSLSGGAFQKKTSDALLLLMNRRFWKGFRRLFKKS